MDQETTFTTSRSQMDSLKIEASMLSPKEDAQTKIVAKAVAGELFSTYKRFIPEETKVKNRKVADRILVTERPTFETMYTDWDTNAWHLPLSGNEYALSLRTGGVMIFDDPNKLWNACTPELQQKLTLECGSEEEARQVVVINAFYDSVAHEVIHQFQSPGLPELFHECAVRYYQRETVQKLGGGYLIDPLTTTKIDFYKDMVTHYGDEIHTLFFNSDTVLWERQQDIYRKFSEAQPLLFPQKEELRVG